MLIETGEEKMWKTNFELEEISPQEVIKISYIWNLNAWLKKRKLKKETSNGEGFLTQCNTV